MSRQQIFYTKRYQRIEKAIVRLLNDQPDFLAARTASSPRAIGDAIQAILSDSFQAYSAISAMNTPRTSPGGRWPIWRSQMPMGFTTSSM